MPEDDQNAEDGAGSKAAAPERIDIEAIYAILSRTYPTFDETENAWVANGLSATPFHNLVSTCLSTMTHTNRVIRACVPLYEKVSTFEELLALDDEELRTVITPVAHYNRKTRNLKIMCRQILDDHGGEIPRSRAELMTLQGVGGKVADIMLNFVFEQPSIAVDTHVLRVLSRLGLVKTASAESAAKIIAEITPARYLRHAHEWLIQHGMKVCVSRRPACEVCPITRYCTYFRELHSA